MQKVERMHKNVSHWPRSLLITIQSTYFHLPTSSPMPCECSRLISNDLRHPTFSITGSSSHNRWIWPHQKRQYHNQRTRSRHAIRSKLQYVVVPTYSSKCNVSSHQISIRIATSTPTISFLWWMILWHQLTINQQIPCQFHLQLFWVACQVLMQRYPKWLQCNPFWSKATAIFV